METIDFNIWTTIASLLLSCLAIGIAIYSSHSTSKTATKQIESIKQLSKLQLEISQMQLEMELARNQSLLKKAQDEYDIISKINNSELSYQVDFKKSMLRQSQEENPKREYQMYSSYQNSLTNIANRLVELKKTMI